MIGETELKAELFATKEKCEQQAYDLLYKESM